MKNSTCSLYVALSSLVTSLEGLHLTNLNEDKICISCKVQEEMDRLMTTASLKPCLQTLSGLNDNFFEISFF